ncbi:polysaccharide deacetylase family protein [Ectothiorhodospira variabilis]|uniref:polysaccharide deacetylase family protein n=1 Tax=Ectothiorhodospira variabilis TaxID=505694 RepID=UPI001EFA9D9D|nr:polysaccharide deacetylase family protein [Ectothiorhodospira variabilis]MCG5495456.1 polysaccharide deacetylase family protein [Ectothiorhodospira variabilis]MCG5505054.1 polysaccharide deacetylase family protein [Ectothiorhodospira variabilis]MCG5508211.1 polysaccharide deacetylase family protein [Ectothiorhodospira variabilis]
MPYIITQDDRPDVCITLSGQSGALHLPDGFFGHLVQDPDAWLCESALPEPPLPQWDTRELAPDILLTHAIVPILFGAADRVSSRLTMGQGDCIKLPVDVLGATFFMLSQYEEAVRPDRDNHDRFPANASLAYRAGFLDRPLVDEYVEILWAALHRLWPGLERRPQQARTLVSCDVDSPFFYKGEWSRMARGLAGDLLKRRSPRLALRNARGQWRARRGVQPSDPHWLGIEHIMSVNEQAGRPAAFFFIPENTDARLDNRVSLDHPHMRSLLREIHQRGHEIGIHPGYNTFRHPEAMARSVSTLRRVLAEEGIESPLLGGRQHYLRWEAPTTARLWDDNGLDYDSTLSYADRPGFRCGTCREYPLYDVRQRRPLRLRERPLIVMECSVIAERYLGLGYSDEALALMRRYRDICHRFRGDFTLLWHNSHFSQEADRRFYQELVT